MSKDRLEEALKAMKSENVPSEQLAETRARVWQKLGGHNMATHALGSQNPAVCSEFQLQFGEYLNGQLDGNRRLLIEDHLSRCPHCRSQLAEQKGEHKRVAMAERRTSWWPRWGTWAAAAALILAAIYLGRAQIYTLVTSGTPRATVASVSGELYQVPGGILQSGSEIGEEETVRTGPGSRAVLRLSDGSLVEVNERSELSLHASWSGRVVRLKRGDVIVQAAKQRGLGHLRVQTRDSVASVKGTVFAVSSGLSGTVVSVIEGSVAVAQTGSDVVLSPGEQAASNPALVSSAQEAVSWSPDAGAFAEILASLANIERGLAESPSPALRTQSRLLSFMPVSTVVFGAIPNLGSTINQTLDLVEQQSAENPVFGQMWNSSEGQNLRQLLGRIEYVTGELGDEIVFGHSLGTPGQIEKISMILAEIQPGKKAELENALNMMADRTNQAPPCYQLTDTLMVVSDSQSHLQWLLGNLGLGAETPFAAAIAEHYQRGVGWLLGLDMETIISQQDISENDFVPPRQVKHIFLERRDDQGIEENEFVVTFKGPRMGMASFLADSGSGAAAEYISSDAIAAMYLSTREPHQMFTEMMELLGGSAPASIDHLALAEAMLGVSFADDLAASIGTESAFALESISASGPVWTAVVLVNNPPALDAFIGKLADTINGYLALAGRTEQIALLDEVVDGRTWKTLSVAGTPISFTWTYDQGYFVAATDRGAALRALANRNGGSSLVWSPTFQQQLPGPVALHPSGFAWLNTKGALQNLAGLVSNPTLQKLVSERDPVLVVFSATEEQIRAVSRTRLLGLIMDMMLLQGLGQTQPATL
jgi:hypothetical protein